MLGVSPDSSDRDAFTFSTRGVVLRLLSAVLTHPHVPVPPLLPFPAHLWCCWFLRHRWQGQRVSDTSQSCHCRGELGSAPRQPQEPCSTEGCAVSPTVPIRKPQDRCTGCLEPTSPTP